MAPSPSLGPLCVLLLLAVGAAPSASGDLAGDAAALLAFRAAVAPRLLQSWNASSANPCSWLGVTCSGNRVTALRLPGAGLTGQVPPGTLGNLTALTVLSLRFNAISGLLPSDLASVAGLRSLFLNNNRFSGPVDVISKLPLMNRLNLASNSFTGEIPAAFSNLTKLRVLLLEENGFFGAIPPLDGASLEQFNVSGNAGVNGSIPASLRRFPASAFLNTGLCGGPLGPCPGEVPPAPAPSPDVVAKAPPPPPLTPMPVVPSSTEKRGKKLSGGTIAGIVVGVVGFLLVAVLVLVACCGYTGRRRAQPAVRPDNRKPPEAAVSAAAVAPVIAPRAAPTLPPTAVPGAAVGKRLVFFGPAAAVSPFDLEDLLRASAEVLGKGAFSTTYKAVLEMGTTVAVKRLKDVVLGEGEFRERVSEIGRMDHAALVPLKAYYYSKEEKLLVYDFMPTGSLSAVLHGSKGSGRTPLNWEMRFNIALATARGIEYIHSTNLSSSHGNIKSSNVLLTNSYEARVSDHGIASLVGPITSPVRVTGYRAPEVIDPRKASQKADVYSFGVLLLEMLTGKAPTQALLNEDGVDLPRWVQSVVKEEWTSEVFDTELLRQQNAEEEMVQVLQLAIHCVAQHPDSRPSMPDVVAQFEDIRRSSGRNSDKDMHDGGI